ncbi:MAG: pilus assembly protein TadG-related protein [Terracidiphilus sp.]|nr:pilus assembly protein TadG-related protein [Terracidiphilus sp.]
MKLLKDERGQTLILAALCFSMLLGLVALAVDVGLMFRAKRVMQTAADSGAIGGAGELNYGDVTAAAQADAARNGVTNGVNGSTVIVNNPPLNGPHAGNASYVEVIVSQSQATYFMNIFGHGSMTVSGRAVAGLRASNGCVYIMNPTASQAMNLQGSFDVSTPGCGVLVNSNAPDALQLTGSGGTLSAGSVAVVGGTGGQVGDSSPAPVTGIAPLNDPLSYIPPPAYNTPSVPCGAVPSGNTIGPATATGTVCYSGNVTLSNVTMNPGVYVFTGNVSFSGTVTGSGVTFYLLGGLNASNGTLNLSAPTSGTYNGLLVFAARDDSNQLTFDKGSASGTLSGIIYAPDSAMVLNDSGGDKNGGLAFTTDLIVNTLYDKTATLTIASYSNTASNSPLTKPTLVE